MCIVAAPQRLASAAVVFFGPPRRHLPTGSTSSPSRAQVPLPRSPLRAAHDLDDSHLRQGSWHACNQQVADLPETQVSKLQAQRPFRVLYIDTRQAGRVRQAPLRPKASSLPVARRLCGRSCIFLGQRTPQRRRPGSPHPAGRSARWRTPVGSSGSTGSATRPPGRRLDEIFFGSKPVLMVVGTPEPLLAQRSPVHQRATARLQASRIPATTRSGACGARWRHGSGQRPGACQPGGVRRTTSRSSATRLDHFHTLREGGRVLQENPKAGPSGPGRLPRKPTRKWLNKSRQGQALTGYATPRRCSSGKGPGAAFPPMGKGGGHSQKAPRFARNCSPLPLPRRVKQS